MQKGEVQRPKGLVVDKVLDSRHHSNLSANVVGHFAGVLVPL
jgi:hypothetical protein